MAAFKEFCKFLESKTCLQNQVKDLIFVENPCKVKGHRCCFCQHVAVDHCIGHCGHVYCFDCFTKNRNKPCPNCQIPVTIYQPDQLGYEKDVYGLMVKCKFRKYGCNEILELRDFLRHAKNCKFAIKEDLPNHREEDRATVALQKLRHAYLLNKEAKKLIKEEINQLEVFQNMNNLAVSKQFTDDGLCNQLQNLKSNEKANEAMDMRNLPEPDNFENEPKPNEMEDAETRIEETENQTETDSMKKLEETDEENRKISGEFQQMNNPLGDAQLSSQETTDLIKTNEGQLPVSAQIDNLPYFEEFREMKYSLISAKLSQVALEKELSELKDKVKNSAKTTEELISVQAENKRISDEFQKAKDLHDATLKTLNDDLSDVKQAMESMQLEFKRISDESQETKKLLEQNKVEQVERLKELTDAVNQSQQTADKIKAKNRRFKEKFEDLDEKFEDLEEKFEDLDDSWDNTKQADSLKELNEAKRLMKTQIMQLENALKQNEKSTELRQLQNKKKESHQNQRTNDLQIKLGLMAGKETTKIQYLDEETPSNALLWKVEGLKKKLQQLVLDKHSTIKTEEFCYVSNGFKFRPWLQSGLDGKYIHIQLEAEKPFFHSRKYILVDQSNALEKHNLELIDRPPFGMNSTEKMRLTKFYNSAFFPVSLLQGENRYVRKGQILILIIIEPISLLCQQIASNDGTFLWQIDNYSKKKKDEVDGLKQYLISKPFKSGSNLFHAELYLNGDEKGTCKGKVISMFTRALVGENDSILASSFKCHITFSILDQSDSHPKVDIINEFSCELDQTNSSWGYSKFAKISEVENAKYLKDDSLMLKAVVTIQ